VHHSTLDWRVIKNKCHAPLGRRLTPLTALFFSSLWPSMWVSECYRGTSLIRNTPLLGPYSRNTKGPTVVLGGGLIIMSEVPLQGQLRGSSECMYFLRIIPLHPQVPLAPSYPHSTEPVTTLRGLTPLLSSLYRSFTRSLWLSLFHRRDSTSALRSKETPSSRTLQ